MTSTTSLAKIGQVAAADLQPGKVFLPFHQGHSEQKRPSRGVEYNLPEDHVPTVIARCQTREDVQLAVRAARAMALQSLSMAPSPSRPAACSSERGWLSISRRCVVS